MGSKTTEGTLFTRLDRVITQRPGSYHDETNILVRVAFMRAGEGSGGALNGEGAADILDETDAQLKGSSFHGVFSSKEPYAVETARLAMMRIKNRVYDPVRFDAFGAKCAFDARGVTIDEVEKKIRSHVGDSCGDIALESIGMWRRYAPEIEKYYLEHIKPQTEQIAEVLGTDVLSHEGKKIANALIVTDSLGAELVYASRNPVQALITRRLRASKTFAIAFTVTPAGDVHQLPVLVGLEPEESYVLDLFGA